MITRTRSSLMHLLAACIASLAAGAPGQGAAAAAVPTPPGPELLRGRCGGCHLQSGGDHFARISDIRKTPEGWLMTIVRMQHLHQAQLSAEERDTLVRYLADTQGLAPAETAPARYALERRPNVKDLQLPGDLQTMCARCHSAARIALQRRDAQDWLKHVHWHLAQWPTIEYQQNARDRLWWQKATTEVPQELGKLFPLHSQAWADWSQRPHADLSGTWLVHGHEPGQGDYWGVATIARTGDDEYRQTYALDTAAGEHVSGESKVILYTGFEWRGSGTRAAREVHEVYALSEDGGSLSGRWFEAAHPEIGADWQAVRAGPAQLLAVNPSALRTGAAARVIVLGSGLDGAVSFGPGTHSRVLERTAHSLSVEVRVDAAATPGYRQVSVGRLSAGQLFAVYDKVTRLEVSPAFAIARLGGGRIDPVAAQFDALAYTDLAGADGVTAVRLGYLPVRWSVQPYDQQARAAQDEKFAGRIDGTGRFLPAAAGPNPQRKFSGNNAGDLAVEASLEDMAPAVTGKAHLIVTVQRWNNPPIY
ncbi:MAG: quinohemoprotein amine dehydrogenase subunit alpha [Proteobacteria bacterium]|nr:quinohemoprotein amine dehydrogenase subunit alpha [Pseudomonadota bacterium]